MRFNAFAPRLNCQPQLLYGANSKAKPLPKVCRNHRGAFRIYPTYKPHKVFE